jgi:diguanylate cyclase (GGDEF)-like protein
MADTRPDLQAALGALRDAYAASLPAKLDELAVQYRALSADNGSQSLQLLHASAHKLAGSAGTFGFEDTGNAARRLEHILREWMAAAHVPDATDLGSLEPILAEMRSQSERQSIITKTVHRQAEPGPLSDKLLIGVVEDDVDLARELETVLTSFGYRSEKYVSQCAARASLNSDRPDAWVLDLGLPEGPLAGADFAMLLKDSPVPPPLAFISVRGDFQARLAAARAGGSGYFVKPLDIATLVDWLDRSTHRHEALPYSILIVDDDVELARYHATLLRAGGMLVTLEHNPHQVMEALSMATPDMILMDLHMPGCSGLEVAAVIRQQETYLGTPIVYLSSESDDGQQQAAMQVGADDFLNKSISPERLVATVRQRAARARQLNMLMSTDSLTGLLKHVKLKEQVAIEITRARRSKTSLAFVMFDMDHFKRVNDTYGHLSGDRVIKTLAHLLKQRLRRSDSIGRYGGEEFAAILPDCGPAAAREVVEDIRQRFSELRFGQPGAEFAVTLSAGIATFPDIDNVEDIIRAADNALYKAKEGGRNRVCLAPATDRKRTV